MNRAAESAVPMAKPLLLDAVKSMVSVTPTFRLPISFGCEIEAKLHIRKATHASPHDDVSWWGVVGAC